MNCNLAALKAIPDIGLNCLLVNRLKGRFQNKNGRRRGLPAIVVQRKGGKRNNLIIG